MDIANIRLVLIVLSFVVLNSAQNPTICDGPSITIRSSEDVSQISSCTTYNGNVIIGPDTTGTIDLHGIEQISGDLVCKNATGLNGIVSDTLDTIGGTFNLENLTTLNNLSFPAFYQVGNVSWTDLVSLSEIDFGDGVEECSKIHISNTALTSLEYSFEMNEVGIIDINNNTWLENITFEALTKISQSATFALNSENLNISMPCLTIGNNLTFHNVWLADMPSLSHVFGPLAFYAGNSLSISVPNLTTIEGSLILNDYNLINSMSFPLLADIGGSVSIENNTALGAIGGVDQLTSIAGNMTLIGTFDSFSCPSLKDIRGAATVMTSSQNQTLCNLVKSLSTDQVIKQGVSCATNMVTPQTNGTAPTTSPTSTATSSKGLSSDARISIVLAAVVVGLSATVTMVWCFCIRPRLLHKRNKRKMAKFGKINKGNSDVKFHGKAELFADPAFVPALTRDKQLKALPAINTTIAKPLSNLQRQPAVSAVNSDDRNFTTTPIRQEMKEVVISPEHTTPWDKYFQNFESPKTHELYVNSRKPSPQPKKPSAKDYSSEQVLGPRTPTRTLFPSPPRVRSTIFFRPDTMFSSSTKNGKSQSDY